MKKYVLVIAVLMSAPQPVSIAQINQEFSTAFAPGEKQWIRSESEIDEAALSRMSFDAFLTEAGYVVYPVEKNILVLQEKIKRNPMILHKDFIPRRVRVVSELAGQNDSRNGSTGSFVVVSEIGSTSVFMVNKKDLHFVQRQPVE